MHLSKWGAPEFTLHLLAGCGATFFHDSVMTPAEVNKNFVKQILVHTCCVKQSLAKVFQHYKAMHCQVVKQRMQMCCSPHKNATSAFRVSWVEMENNVENKTEFKLSRRTC